MKLQNLILAVFVFQFAVSVQGAGQLRLQWGTIDTSSPVRQRLMGAAKGGGDSSERCACIVQFEGAVTGEWREWLESVTQVRGYIPDNAYLVFATADEMAAIAAHEGVNWTGEWKKEYKTVCSGACTQPATRNAKLETRWMRINSLKKGAVGAEDLRARLEDLGAEVRSAYERLDGSTAVALITDGQIEEIAGWVDIEWIEPHRDIRLLNDRAVLPNMMNIAMAWESADRGGLGLTGAGQIVAVADSGFDTGSLDDVHPDFSDRVIAGYGWSNHTSNATISWNDTYGHGTHVAGSILGNGAQSDGLYRGVAWQAKLVVQRLHGCEGDGFHGLPENAGDLLKQAYDAGARIHSDSWAIEDDFLGDHDAFTCEFDEFMWTHQDFLTVFAAGNNGKDANQDGVVDPGSVLRPSTAKNCVSVGAAETGLPVSPFTWGMAWPDAFPVEPICYDMIASLCTPQGMAAFSSRGPAADGRIKPDIVAPGTYIASVRSRATESLGWGAVDETGNYIYMGGTSMATPLTSGTLALIRQWLVEEKKIDSPPAALMKALLISGARDMSPGQYGTGKFREILPRPDISQGFGHVDLYGTLNVDANRDFLTLVTNRLERTGDAFTDSIEVGATRAGKHVVVLAWQDYPGSSGAAKLLVNDLDLTVTSPSGRVYYPNGLSEPDRLNNVELIEFEAEETGSYSVKVAAGEIAKGGGQPFALVMRGPNTAHDATSHIVTNVTISGDSPDSAVISWDICEHATSYIIRTYGVCTNGIPLNDIEVGDVHSYTLTGLDRGSCYGVRVKGDDGGQHSFSWSKPAYTLHPATYGLLPVWSALPPAEIALGEELERFDPGDYVTGAAKPDGIYFVDATAPANTFDFADGALVRFKPDAPGTYDFTFCASNGVGRVRAIYTVTVRDAPCEEWMIGQGVDVTRHNGSEIARNRHTLYENYIADIALDNPNFLSVGEFHLTPSNSWLTLENTSQNRWYRMLHSTNLAEGLNTVTDLGWGSSNMVVPLPDPTPQSWFGRIRVFLREP